jgi:hypothetical protein
MDNLPLINNSCRVWLQKHQSTVVIQQHVRGMLVRMNVESMHINAYNGSPSLLEDDSSASTSFAIATMLQLLHEISAIPDESSVSSFSTSQSLWEKGFNPFLPRGVFRGCLGGVLTSTDHISPTNGPIDMISSDKLIVCALAMHCAL